SLVASGHVEVLAARDADENTRRRLKRQPQAEVDGTLQIRRCRTRRAVRSNRYWRCDRVVEVLLTKQLGLQAQRLGRRDASADAPAKSVRQGVVGRTRAENDAAVSR